VKQSSLDTHAIEIYQLIAALAFAAPSQLPALSYRPAGVGLRHLDAAGRAELAVYPDRIRHPARRRRLRIQIPILALGPIGGVISDRYSCHRVAVWTQCAALVQAVLLASLTLLGWIQPLHIILLGAALGVVYAFDMPARQALVHELVDAGDLSNAVALNSSMINAARIVGPALAGLVVAKFGEGVCFVINAVSYIATIAALLMMKLAERPQRETAPSSISRSLIDGYRYTLATPIRDLLILLGVVACGNTT
jgi:MFS family permease